MFNFWKKPKQPFSAPAPNESALRGMLHDAGQTPYNQLKTFKEAKQDPSGYAIMEGDYGGQVYLSVPMQQISCNESALMKLLEQVDSLGWNDPEGATLYYEKATPGQGIPGGMGGGLTDKTLWVHKNLRGKRSAIESYLAGAMSTIL